MTTGNGTCNAVSDQMTITINPAPVVNAGPDRTICGDMNGISLNGASIANASGGRWTTNGNGTFTPNEFAVNATYLITDNDRAQGNVSLVLTTEGNGLCNAVSDEMVLTITPRPTVNAGPDRTICAGSSVNLSGLVTVATGGTWATASGNGTFTPGPTFLNTSFTPTATQVAAGQVSITLTTTGNGTCNPVSDNMILTIQPVPVVNAGFNRTVCETVNSINLNGAVQHAAGGLWSTSGTGTFSPDANTLNAQYIPSTADKAAEQITLTLTSTGNAPCSAVSRSILIRFTRQPTVDAGPATICSNANTVPLSGTFTNAGGVVWSTSGSGTFSPSSVSLTPNYTPTQADRDAGSVTLTLTTTDNGGCTAATDNILVSIVAPPTANPGPNQIVCANNPTVNLNGSVGGTATGGQWSSSGGGSFSPSNTNLNAQYTLSAVDQTNGFADLTLTTTGTGACAPASQTMRVNITPAPIANAGPDMTVCADTAGVAINGNMTIATGGTWTTSGSGYFADPNVIDPVYHPVGDAGQVTLTLTSTGNGNCTAVSDQMILTVNPTPTINAGDDETICSDGFGFRMTADVNGASEGVWSASGNGSFVDEEPQNFRATYVISEDDITNGSVTLIITTTEQGLCKPVSDSFVLDFESAPVVSAGAANVCADSPTIPLFGSFSNALGIEWTTSGNGSFDNINDPEATYTPTVDDRDAGTIVLTIRTIMDVSDICEAAEDSIVINFGAIPEADAGPDQTVCANNAEVTLIGNSNTGSGIWSTSGTGTFADATSLSTFYTPSAADTAAGVVRLILTTEDNDFCSADRDTMLVTITPAPFVDAGPAVACGNNLADPIYLDGTITVATGGIWSTPDGEGSFDDPNSLSTFYTFHPNDLSKSSITLILTSDDNGDCNPVSDQIVVHIAPPPTATAGGDQVVCADTAGVQLNGAISGAGGGVWASTGSGTFDQATALDAVYTPSAADTAAGVVTLYLTTTDNGNCLAESDSLEITITPAPTVDAGGAVVCANNGTIDLNGSFTVASGVEWTTNGQGIIGDELEAITTYTLGGNDTDQEFITLTITTTGNGDCKAVSDQVTLYIAPPPVADAGDDVVVCADTSGIELNGSVLGDAGIGGTWTSSGSGGFADADNPVTTYFPTAADTANGSVTLRLTTTNNGNCNAVFDEMLVTITPAPTVSAGPDITICADEADVNLTGSATVATQIRWTSSGTGTFTPDNALITQYMPSDADTAAGFVYLRLETLVQGDCRPVIDSMRLTIVPAPVVDAGPALLCSDDTGVEMPARVLHAGGATWTSSGNGSFAPNANQVNPIYIPSTDDRDNGSVVLTITSTGNGSCQAYSDQITLNITPPPGVDAGPDMEICANSGGMTLTGSVTNAPGGIWTTSGSGDFQPSDTDMEVFYVPSADDTLAGSVVIRLTTTGMEPCFPVYDEMTLTFTPAPIAIVNAGSDTTLCADSPEVPLTGFISVASGGMWVTTGTGFFTPDEYTLNSTYIPSEDDINSGGIELILRTTGNGDCNPVTDTIVVTYLPRPLAVAGDDFTICADLDEFTLDGEVFNAPGSLWHTSGSGTFSDPTDVDAIYYPSDADKADGFVIFTLETTGNLACSESFDNVRVTINPAPTVFAGADRMVCADAGGVQLTGEFANAGGILWSSSTNGSFSEYTELSTIYYLSSEDSTNGSVTIRLITTDNGLCMAVADSLVITITDAPTIDAGDPQEICGDNTVVSLSGSVTVASGATWSSSGTGSFAPGSNSLNAEYYVSDADISTGFVDFTLTSTGNGSCNSVNDVMRLTINPVPTVNPGANMTVCRDRDEIQLNGVVTVAGGGRWSSFGTGTFSDDEDLNAFYYPSQADKNAGQVMLRLTSIDNDLCNPVFRNMRITFTTAPTVNAGSNRTVCADVTGIQLNGSVTVATGGEWTSNGNGTFEPNATTLNAIYVPSQDDIDDGGVILTLTTTGNGICNPISSTINITITPAPESHPDGVRVVCADIDGVSLNGAVTVANGGTWSSNGSGTFTPDAHTLNASYVPSTQDRQDGHVILRLTTTGNGTCNAVSDTIHVAITPAPTVNAGPDEIVCANNVSVALQGEVTVAAGGRWSGGSGTYTNNDQELNATYTPSAAEIAAGQANLRLTTTGNGTCNAVFDNMRITITPAPVVSAGQNVTVCANNAAVQLNGSVSVSGGGRWLGGTGTFSPSRNALNAIYEPSQVEKDLGIVVLTLESTGNGDCLAESRTVTIRITPAPTAYAGDNRTVCADIDHIQLFGYVSDEATGGIWTSSGSGHFLPNANTLDARYVPSSADRNTNVIHLTLTTTGSGSCLEVSHSMRVNITPRPTINAGEDVSICYDTDGVPLNGNRTVATGSAWSSSGSGSFDPGPNSLTANYIPSLADRNAGVVRLTLTTIGTGTCNTYTDDMLITFTPRPTVDAGPTITVCADVEGIDLSGSVTVASGGRWSTSGSGYFEPNASMLSTQYIPSAADTAARQVQFTLTTTGNGTCKAYFTSKEVNITPSPVVATGEASVCADLSGAPVSGTVHNANGGRWTTSGSGYFAPNEYALDATYYPSQADMNTGLATLTLTSEGNGTCNPVQTQMTVIVTELPVADAGEDMTICRNGSAYLVARPVPDVAYNWYTMDGVNIGTSGIITISASADTSFVLSVTDYKGCTIYDTVNVFVFDPPVLQTTAHECFDEGLVLDANPSFVQQGLYQWFRDSNLLLGANGQTFEVQEPGMHFVMFIFGECIVFGENFTFVTPLPEIETEDKLVCIGANSEISTTQNEAYTYEWSFGGSPVPNSNSHILNISAANAEGQTDIYSVRATDNFGCSSTQEIEVTTYPPPSIHIENVDACDGDVVTLNARPSNIISPQSMYNWFKDGESLNLFTESIQVNLEGEYSVIYSLGEEECVTHDTTTVAYHAYPETDMENLVKACLEFEGTSLNAGPGHSYLWENGSTTQVLDATSPGIYDVIVYNQYGCGTKDSVVLENVCPPRMYQPNAFAPNGDPRDRVFRVYGAHIGKFSLTIFNRWGEIIFYSENPEEGWDGTFRGQEMPPGSYPYIISYESEFEEFKSLGEQYQGKVTLIR
ncbi:MAG: T9SS type B sorting domain-containing protein [Cytophagaceae bacterium]